MVAMEIELVRGTPRRKHVEAVLVGDRLRVSFPRWMSIDEAQVTAQELAERMRRRTDSSAIDVAARARRLARDYHLPRPRSVRWVDNMRQRWGSCTPEDGAVRVSSRLAADPSWGLDYVLARADVEDDPERAATMILQQLVEVHTSAIEDGR